MYTQDLHMFDFSCVLPPSASFPPLCTRYTHAGSVEIGVVGILDGIDWAGKLS